MCVLGMGTLGKAPQQTARAIPPKSHSVLPIFSATPHDQHLAIVVTDLDHFRRHPVWRANKSVALAHGVCQLRRHSKISELDLPVFCQQDVATLDVAVHLQEG